MPPVKGDGMEIYMNEMQLIDSLRNSKIIIYGAGMVGELLYKRLCSYNLKNSIFSFAVTKSNGEQKFLELPVYQIDDLTGIKSEVYVIVATFPEFHKEIVDNLLRLGFQNIIKIDMEAYEDMADHYIENYKNCEKKESWQDIDILFMASDNNPSSGAFLSMSDLNVELNKAGISTMVVLPCYGNGENILWKKKIAYTYVKSEDWCIRVENNNIEEKYQKLEINEKAINQIQGIIQKYHVRIVHNNTVYTYVGAIAAQKEGKPVVWHIREDIKVQGMKFCNEDDAAKLINQSDCIITISHFMKNCYKGFNQSKVKVIYDGLDRNRFYCERNILAKSEIEIVMCGAITRYKGQHQLIEALGYIRKELRDHMHISFIGNGNAGYLYFLKEESRNLGIELQISFMGRIDNVQDFYKKSDIAVVCSSEEPFGRVTVEGMLSGCLVIGSNSGATPELIKDGITGMLYEQGNSKSLAECIIKAIEDSEKAKKIAKQGQKYAYEIYSKENNAKGIVKVYQKILGRMIV